MNVHDPRTLKLRLFASLVQHNHNRGNVFEQPQSDSKQYMEDVETMTTGLFDPVGRMTEAFQHEIHNGKNLALAPAPAPRGELGQNSTIWLNIKEGSLDISSFDKSYIEGEKELAKVIRQSASEEKPREAARKKEMAALKEAQKASKKEAAKKNAEDAAQLEADLEKALVASQMEMEKQAVTTPISPPKNIQKNIDQIMGNLDVLGYNTITREQAEKGFIDSEYNIDLTIDLLIEQADKELAEKVAEKVARITALGFTKEQARDAMSRFDGDVDRSVDFLFTKS